LGLVTSWPTSPHDNQTISILVLVHVPALSYWNRLHMNVCPCDWAVEWAIICSYVRYLEVEGSIPIDTFKKKLICLPYKVRSITTSVIIIIFNHEICTLDSAIIV
jgi:hypothetical protein